MCLTFAKAYALRIRRLESKNSMSISNLSIVFGPTLLGAPPEMGGLNLEHMSFQCKVSSVCWAVDGPSTDL